MTLPGPAIYPGIPAFPPYFRSGSYAHSLRLRQQEEEYRKREEANARAEKLFLSRLTPLQLQEFQRSKEFPVQGGKGTWYRINCTKFSGNVQRVSDGIRFCAGPFGLPAYDFWLAQKLLIESDEDAFLKVARQYPAEIQIRFDPHLIISPRNLFGE